MRFTRRVIATASVGAIIALAVLALVGPASARTSTPAVVAHAAASPAPTCPKGYQFDKASGSCAKSAPTPACPNGYKYNSVTKQCDSTNPPMGPTTTGGCGTDANGVQYCDWTATDYAVKSDQKVENLTITSGGALQVMPFAPHGSSAPKPKSQCQTFPYGTNSYRTANGGYVKIPWPHRTLACRDSRSPSGWVKRGPVDCLNYFWPPNMKPTHIYYGKYKVVNHFSYTAKLSLTISLHSTISADARCTLGDANNGASAHANVNGSDNESVRVTGTGSGSSWGQAVANATVQAMNAHEINNLHAKVVANATGKLQGQASVACHFTPPPAVCTDTTASNYGQPLPCQRNPPPSPNKNLTCDSVSRAVGDRVVNISDVGWTSSGYIVDHVNIGWGDGASDNKGATHPVTASHTYTYGTYTVIVRVVASDGTSVTSANCTFTVSWTAPPPPTPVTHYTNLTCTGPEEMTGGGSLLVVCQVSNDNGAQIALSADVTSNSGNLRVSGITCKSQGTTACQGNGTYEVRLAGTNEGTSPVYSNLRIVATSNGVPSTPFQQAIKVDPRCSNFGC